MKYILFIWLVTSDGPTQFYHPFDSKQACEIAAANVHVLQGRRPELRAIITECRPGRIDNAKPKPKPTIRT